LVGTKELFLFKLDVNSEISIEQIVKQPTDVNNFYTSFTNNRKDVSNFSGVGNRIDIAFCAESESSFEKTLIISLYNQTTELYDTVAEIYCYAESESEDVRFNDMLTNIGAQIPQQDFKIFKTTDPNEPIPDWKIINPKRKEYLLVQREIKNFEMSYRGLINAIRFYGYDLGIKEYWENVDVNSDNYGKFRLVDIIDGLNDDLKQIENQNNLFALPNRAYKKTRFLKLVYYINRTIPDEVDIQNLPRVRESSPFSFKEISEKLFLLKKKTYLHIYYEQ